MEAVGKQIDRWSALVARSTNRNASPSLPAGICRMGNPFPCVFMQATREEEHRKHIAELVEETASLRHEKNETEQSLRKISFPC